MGSGNFEGERAAHCKVYEHFAVSCAKMAEPIEMPFGFGTRVGPGNHVLDGGPDAPMGSGSFKGREGKAHCQV